MNNTAMEFSDKRTKDKLRIEPSTRTLPAWWLVCKRELNELWIWGKAITLIIFYSIYLGVSSYVFAANNELSLLPPREMVYLTISGAITVGLFIALIIGADSFSGERERSTLEALLLTPASRRQIVVGKFLASTLELAEPMEVSTCPGTSRSSHSGGNPHRTSRTTRCPGPGR